MASTYSGSSWCYIAEHLADILGKQSLEMGNAHGALQHTGQLLLLAAKSGRSAATQQQYLEQFTHLINKVAAQQVGKRWYVGGFTFRIALHGNGGCHIQDCIAETYEWVPFSKLHYIGT